MGEEFSIVGEMKFDGTSISLTYRDGRLVRAVTRGDGERGDIVTDNVMTIKSVPLQLNGSGWPQEFEIRGEIVLPWKAFDRLNAEREFNEEPLFANPRNAAAEHLRCKIRPKWPVAASMRCSTTCSATIYPATTTTTT